jgi:aspartyl-tRNA(Asn)/glutamyl-tRNA(Gln) amidotransferase subunit C
MSLTPADIARLARLARLDLPAAQAGPMLDQLNAVLGLIDQLQAVDTTGVAPMTHPLAMPLRLRPDLVTEPDGRERYQHGAPAVEQGLYLVPRVIE